MTKQNVLMENAERLYVLEQMSINTVAEKVGVNERTIRRWKTDNKWDFKRKQYIKTKGDGIHFSSSFIFLLYNF